MSAVYRSIICNNNLKWSVSLIEEASDCALNEAHLVISKTENRNFQTHLKSYELTTWRKHASSYSHALVVPVGVTNVKGLRRLVDRRRCYQALMGEAW